MEFSKKSLQEVLTKKWNQEVVDAEFNITQAKGGTVGDVSFVTGTAEMSMGEKKPFQLIYKMQKKWERYGDPNSWRREYDLYRSELSNSFADSLRWPECYSARMNPEETEFELWLEYIEGTTGTSLTLQMYKKAAFELGRYQGRLYAEQPDYLKKINNLSEVDFMKNGYLHYRSWNVVYDYIRSEECEIPKEFCRLMMHLDETSEEIFRRLESLPVVLCHRDFWVANIFYSKGDISLIDWDTAGFGYMGEDIASLVADEADLSLMPQLFSECAHSYYEGFRMYCPDVEFTDNCIFEMILMKFGYRLVEGFLETFDEEDPEEASKNKELILNTMQKICEMRQ